jgi:3-deoxy-D-manno-octulosonic acid (KDO) 8-phosphate synthase
VASLLPFVSQVMTSSAEKVRLAGNPNVMVCERGTMFGYSESFVFFSRLLQLKSGQNGFAGKHRVLETGCLVFEMRSR